MSREISDAGMAMLIGEAADDAPLLGEEDWTMKQEQMTKVPVLTDQIIDEATAAYEDVPSGDGVGVRERMRAALMAVWPQAALDEMARIIGERESP